MDLWALLLRLVVGLAATIVAARYSLGLVAWRISERLEKPACEYPAYVVAETTFRRSDLRTSSSQGFRACAGYIFGKNKIRGARGGEVASTKMAMTAPVRMRQCANGDCAVSFVMARNESLRTLPIPDDAAVKLTTVPAHTAAFVAFSGPPPETDLVEEKKRLVVGELVARGIVPPRDAETLIYGYHDPFATPNLLRKNEVGLMLRPHNKAVLKVPVFQSKNR